MALVARPVEGGVGLVDDLEVDLPQGRLRLHDQAAEVAEAAAGGVHLHGLGVGGHDVAVVDRHLLLAEQQLGGPHPEAVLAALQQAPGDDMGELVEEQRRHRESLRLGAVRLREDLGVGGLDRAGLDQAVAEAEDNLIVLPGVRIGELGQSGLGDGLARVGQQAPVQRDLGGTGLGDRPDLRPPEIGSQEGIGDRQVTGLGLLPQQMIAGISPEVGHGATIGSATGAVQPAGHQRRKGI